MGSFSGIAVGVLIGLVTAIAPVHYVNLVFCAGLIVAGYVAVRVAGRSSDEMESVQGFRIGLWVGMLVAVLSFALNWLVRAGTMATPATADLFGVPASGFVLDAIPPVFTALTERFFAGFRSLISGGFSVGTPGVTLGQRFAFGLLLLPFFSAIGGIMGASMFRRQPPVAPDRAQEVPVTPY